MKVGLIITLFSVFTTVFAGSMWIVSNTVKVELAILGDSLATRMDKKVSSYQNVFTADEMLEMTREERAKDTQDLKKFIEDNAKKQTSQLKRLIDKERTKYDTVFYETDNGIKFLLIGSMFKNNFYLLREEEVNKFPFE